MTDLTLPGTLPGLLRRGSPVEFDGFPGVVVQEYAGGGFHVTRYDRRDAVADADELALDLSDPTGEAHALWWLGMRCGLPLALAMEAHLTLDGEGWSITVDGSRWAWGHYGDAFQKCVPALRDVIDRREALRLICLHEVTDV